MKQETWWDPQPESMFLKRKISWTYQESKFEFSIPQPSLNILNWLLTYFSLRDKMENNRMGTVGRHRIAAGRGGREGDKKKRYQWTCGFRFNIDR
jgi:hypothetical protein